MECTLKSLPENWAAAVDTGRTVRHTLSEGGSTMNPDDEFTSHHRVVSHEDWLTSIRTIRPGARTVRYAPTASTGSECT